MNYMEQWKGDNYWQMDQDAVRRWYAFFPDEYTAETNWYLECKVSPFGQQECIVCSRRDRSKYRFAALLMSLGLGLFVPSLVKQNIVLWCVR